MKVFAILFAMSIFSGISFHSLPDLYDDTIERGFNLASGAKRGFGTDVENAPAEEGERGNKVRCQHSNAVSEVLHQSLMQIFNQENAVEAGVEFWDKYEDDEISLGAGAFGKVRQVRNVDTGSPGAMKILHARYGMQETLILETLAMYNVRHCLHMRDAFVVQREEAPEENEFLIVTDCLPVEDMQKLYIGPSPRKGILPYDLILTAAKQLFEYLADLRMLGIMHLDLKHANLILEEETRHLTVLDNGLSRKVSSDMFCNRSGTPRFMSPEMIWNGPVDCSSDIWSAGCILYQLFTNLSFTEGKDYKSILNKIISEIGMPSKHVLDKRKNGAENFNHHVLPNLPSTSWKDNIRSSGAQRNLSTEQIAQFIDLLERMLRYENRATPEELLNLPLFQLEVSFHLCSTAPPEENFVVYRAVDADAHDHDPLFAPAPARQLFVHCIKRVHRVCFHMIRDPNNEYIIETQSSRFSPIKRSRVRIFEGDTLCFKDHQALVFPLDSTHSNTQEAKPPPLFEHVRLLPPR